MFVIGGLVLAFILGWIMFMIARENGWIVVIEKVSGMPLDAPAEKIFQGPIADALTHVGQLALLRGMAHIPVRPESYARAAITVGRVGADQPPPGREFDGDASARP